MSRTIPKSIKDIVKHRQKGNCACCLSPGIQYHHVLAFSVSKKHIDSSNIVLLCQNHHNLFHLGDPDTFQSIYEYAFYLAHGKIPEEKDSIEIANSIIERLKKFSL